MRVVTIHTTLSYFLLYSWFINRKAYLFICTKNDSVIANSHKSVWLYKECHARFRGKRCVTPHHNLSRLTQNKLGIFERESFFLFVFCFVFVCFFGFFLAYLCESWLLIELD